MLNHERARYALKIAFDDYGVYTVTTMESIVRLCKPTGLFKKSFLPLITQGGNTSIH
jgi:hypothetical protein